jgi:rfaE bifunctional protein kinase chain/domain/rfaE bifunctional protein nucleotidyltransferase chain/domain
MARTVASEQKEGKIKGLEELALTLENLRRPDRKVIHCHGVFDLLHVGHIRHFQEAKKLGGLLVVTITQDQFVNKGPHRPAFPENLRAEAIAALDCVDFVGINKWPNAVEVIQLLRPDYYVKGSDYRDAAKDHTGGIVEEEAAVRSVGGQIGFTDEIAFSASTLINRHFPVFSEEVNTFREQFSKKFDSDQIIGYLENAKKLKVLVIGEAIIDEYQYCEAIGKSSKEPMLALKRNYTEHFPGGALAVANHIANFSDNVGLVTFLGEVNSHERFIRDKLNSKIQPNFLYRKDAPTIVKRRFIEKYFFTKLLEVYDINDSALDPLDNDALCKRLATEIPKYDVVVVMDFGHSMFTQEAVNLICKESAFLAVNAQTNAGNIGYQSLSRYPRANYVCLTENEMRMESRDRRGSIEQMILDIAHKHDYERITVTRGQRGCLSYTKEGGFVEVPAFAGKVLDRMGAGDAFLSLTALCVAQNVPAEAVAFIGNAVGAQAVAMVGHRSSIERAPLYKHITALLK